MWDATENRIKRLHQEDGIALVLIALLLMAIVGLLALSFDFARINSVKRQHEGLAKTAALQALFKYQKASIRQPGESNDALHKRSVDQVSKELVEILNAESNRMALYSPTPWSKSDFTLEFGLKFDSLPSVCQDSTKALYQEFRCDAIKAGFEEERCSLDGSCFLKRDTSYGSDLSQRWGISAVLVRLGMKSSQGSPIPFAYIFGRVIGTPSSSLFSEAFAVQPRVNIMFAIDSSRSTSQITHKSNGAYQSEYAYKLSQSKCGNTACDPTSNPLCDFQAISDFRFQRPAYFNDVRIHDDRTHSEGGSCLDVGSGSQTRCSNDGCIPNSPSENPSLARIGWDNCVDEQCGPIKKVWQDCIDYWESPAQCAIAKQTEPYVNDPVCFRVAQLKCVDKAKDAFGCRLSCIPCTEKDGSSPWSYLRPSAESDQAHQEGKMYIHSASDYKCMSVSQANLSFDYTSGRFIPVGSAQSSAYLTDQTVIPEPLGSILDAMHIAMLDISAQALPNTRVGFVTFANGIANANGLMEPAEPGSVGWQRMLMLTDRSMFHQNAEELASMGFISDPSASTNIPLTLMKLYQFMTKSSQMLDSKRVIIMFTDGISSIGYPRNMDPKDYRGDEDSGGSNYTQYCSNQLNIDCLRESVLEVEKVLETYYRPVGIAAHFIVFGDHGPNRILYAGSGTDGHPNRCLSPLETVLSGRRPSYASDARWLVDQGGAPAADFTSKEYRADHTWRADFDCKAALIQGAKDANCSFINRPAVAATNTGGGWWPVLSPCPIPASGASPKQITDQICSALPESNSGIAEYANRVLVPAPPHGASSGELGGAVMQPVENYFLDPQLRKNNDPANPLLLPAFPDGHPNTVGWSFDDSGQIHINSWSQLFCEPRTKVEGGKDVPMTEGDQFKEYVSEIIKIPRIVLENLPTSTDAKDW